MQCGSASLRSTAHEDVLATHLVRPKKRGTPRVVQDGEKVEETSSKHVFSKPNGTYNLSCWSSLEPNDIYNLNKIEVLPMPNQLNNTQTHGPMALAASASSRAWTRFVVSSRSSMESSSSRSPWQHLLSSVFCFSKLLVKQKHETSAPKKSSQNNLIRVCFLIRPRGLWCSHARHVGFHPASQSKPNNPGIRHPMVAISLKSSGGQLHKPLGHQRWVLKSQDPQAASCPCSKWWLSLELLERPPRNISRANCQATT